MSSTVSFCPTCGRALTARPGGYCPQCSPAFHPEPITPPQSGAKWSDLLWAFVVWGVSGGFALILESGFRFALWLANQRLPEGQITRGVVIFSLTVTLVMQLAGLAAAWLVVTRIGRRPFWRTLGWGWIPQFRLVHAIGLAILMIGVAIVLEQVLPHKETDLEKFLKMGMGIRIMVAALAVLTAPLIEEIVYRGLIYSSVEGLMGKGAAVTFVTLLFALVHAPQYWGSVAALTAIVSLSFVLTLLRAWTGNLLPCVATHLVYNGIQAVFLLLAPEEAINNQPNQAALTPVLKYFVQSLGLS
ncbi:MAG: lysostaphin resistance A-like protein [Blastocatellia bacterium]